MSTSNNRSFTADFPFATATSFDVGDILTYRFRVSDFAGNTRTFPQESEQAITVEYRLRDQIDLLAQATPSGFWQRVEAGWEIEQNGDPVGISSLVFGPLDLPDNVDNLQMLLFFEHSFIDDHGGNIKLSTDNANTWSVIDPIGEYNGFFIGC